jgi:AraC family ethanolamine operon transcriptional activator
MRRSIKNPKRAGVEASVGARHGDAEPPRPSLRLGRFSDLDQLAEVTAAWDLDFARIDRSPFVGQIGQLDLGDIRYDLARFRSPLEQRGSPPEGRWTIAIPDNAAPRMVWRGRTLEAGMVPVYRPGSEIDVVSRRDFCVMPIAFEPPMLARLCQELDLPAFEHRLQRSDVLMVDPRRVARISRVLRRMFAALAADTDLCSLPPFHRDLRERIPKLLLRTLAGSVPAPPTRRRGRTIARCLEVIEASDPSELTVAGLAREVGVSERALQHAFAKWFQLTPKTYLKTRQLIAVRRRLRRAPKGTRVSEIAGACGFWHLGQFAADYRGMFGELPSQTLVRRGDI